MTASNEFTIPLSQWADFIASMAKLNRKAGKLGCEPITWDVLGEGMVERSYSYKVNGETQDKTVNVMARTIALHGTAPKAWQRANNMAVEYAKRHEAQKDSLHVGEIGKRMKGVPAKIEHLRSLEGGIWGPRTLVKFLDDAGNVMTWFASGDHDLRVGESVKIDGTVKKHDEYQGIKQTVLSRVVVHHAVAA